MEAIGFTADDLEANRAELESRVNNYRQYELKCQERETLATEVVPVLSNYETRKSLANKLRDLHKQRLQSTDDRRQHRRLRRAVIARPVAVRTDESLRLLEGPVRHHDAGWAPLQQRPQHPRSARGGS